MPHPQLDTPLLNALKAYEQLGRKRFTVPGHAGNVLANAGFAGLPSDIYRYDQTEVEGLDVLSEPTECIKAAQEVAAEAIGVRNSFFLVNGSTAGLLAGMLSVLKPQDKVLLPRNIHRSVISGLVLTGAVPVWFLPDWCSSWGLWQGIQLTQIEKILVQNPDIKALMLTSPTYEGMGTDIAPIAQLCDSRGIRLLIDEAHGSLWPYSDRLPDSATTFHGCDLVVQSTHKNAGSLTQSAMAHLPFGSQIDPNTYQQALNLIQTTSPSYILMASLDASRSFWCSPAGQARLAQYLDQVNNFREQIRKTLGQFELFEPVISTFWDSTRILLRSRNGESGELWAPRIELDWNIPYEACSEASALYITGVGLEPGDYSVFLQAFLKEQAVPKVDNTLLSPAYTLPTLPQQALSPREAYFSPGISVKTKNSVGEIAKTTVVHCPPGIPVLFPGELIQTEYLPYLPETIQVVRKVY